MPPGKVFAVSSKLPRACALAFALGLGVGACEGPDAVNPMCVLDHGICRSAETNARQFQGCGAGWYDIRDGTVFFWAKCGGDGYAACGNRDGDACFADDEFGKLELEIPEALFVEGPLDLGLPGVRSYLRRDKLLFPEPFYEEEGMPAISIDKRAGDCVVLRFEVSTGDDPYEYLGFDACESQSTP